MTSQTQSSKTFIGIDIMLVGTISTILIMTSQTQPSKTFIGINIMLVGTISTILIMTSQTQPSKKIIGIDIMLDNDKSSSNISHLVPFFQTSIASFGEFYVTSHNHLFVKDEMLFPYLAMKFGVIVSLKRLTKLMIEFLVN